MFEISDAENYRIQEDNRFLYIRECVLAILDAYIFHAPDSIAARLVEYKAAAESFLSNYSQRRDDVDDFSFSVFRRDEESSHWFGFRTDCISISLDEGESLYSPDIGIDTNTVWEYTLWNTGESDGDFNLRYRDVRYLIENGAELSIELPNEFCNIFGQED